MFSVKCPNDNSDKVYIKELTHITTNCHGINWAHPILQKQSVNMAIAKNIWHQMLSWKYQVLVCWSKEQHIATPMTHQWYVRRKLENYQTLGQKISLSISFYVCAVPIFCWFFSRTFFIQKMVTQLNPFPVKCFRHYWVVSEIYQWLPTISTFCQMSPTFPTNIKCKFNLLDNLVTRILTLTMLRLLSTSPQKQ